jgi:hypothetical protein
MSLADGLVTRIDSATLAVERTSQTMLANVFRGGLITGEA